MTRFIISRGTYVVHNIIIEAEDEDSAIQIARDTPLEDGDWQDCGAVSDDVLYECEGEH